jgi:hypothetical protein
LEYKVSSLCSQCIYVLRLLKLLLVSLLLSSEPSAKFHHREQISFHHAQSDQNRSFLESWTPYWISHGCK